MGVITGDRFVNGNPLPKDFAAQTGYVQQMDIHLESTSELNQVGIEHIIDDNVI